MKFIKKYFKIFFVKNYSFKKWFEDNGDQILRFDYKLNKNSIFFELGGFEGNYSDKIIKKFSPQTYIFEPDNNLFNKLVNKFNDKKNIKVFNDALSDKEQTLYLIKKGENSFISNKFSENAEKVNCIKLSSFIEKNKIREIDLLNMNIEGSEYKVLLEIIKSSDISKIKHLQIQFHKNTKFYILKRKYIQFKLKDTHKLIWNYDFVWERWDKK